MTKTLRLLSLALIVFVVAGLLPFDAFAQNVDSWQCSGQGISKIFCSMTNQFRFLPKLLSILSYVAAAIFAFKGLMQLKEYGDDPSKTPLQSILVKLAIAAMLISLPLAMQVFITTVTGAKDMTAGTTLSKPHLGKGVAGH